MIKIATARLILIRHGETDWSSQKRYCSFTDVDLNEKGKRQAEQLSKKLSKEKIDKVYASDLKRAYNFARIVFPGFPVEKVPDLQEINFGIFEGFTYRQILRQYPEIYKSWVDNPLDTVIPGGESLTHLAKRVRKAISEILSLDPVTEIDCENRDEKAQNIFAPKSASILGVICKQILGRKDEEILRRIPQAISVPGSNNKTVAVVSHAGPIKVILSDILNLSLREVWQVAVDLSSVNIVEFIGGRPQVRLSSSEPHSESVFALG